MLICKIQKFEELLSEGMACAFIYFIQIYFILSSSFFHVKYITILYMYTYTHTHIIAKILTHIINEILLVLLKYKDFFPFGNRGEEMITSKLFLLLTMLINSGQLINKTNGLRHRKANTIR